MTSQENIALKESTANFEAAKAALVEAARTCAKTQVEKVADYLKEKDVRYARKGFGPKGFTLETVADESDAGYLKASFFPELSIGWERGLLEC